VREVCRSKKMMRKVMKVMRKSHDRQKDPQKISRRDRISEREDIHSRKVWQR
jgi:uncharacterized protein YaiI (UPF0178 family)